MSKFGHFNVSRKALLSTEQGGDPFWNEPRSFSRWEAWEYLFGKAARWGECRWTLKSGEVIDLARGETKPLSVRYLETRWRWSRSKVQRFLQALVEMNRIAVHQSTPMGDTYVIVKYDAYQAGWDTSEPESGTEVGQRRDKKETSKAGKEVNTPFGSSARETRKNKRAVPLPDDWSPSDQHSELADSLEVDLDAEVEQFKDHHAARGTTFKEWDRAFNTWLRNAKRFNREAPSDRSHLSVVTGGLLEREAADKERIEREKREYEENQARSRRWQQAVHEQFAKLSDEEREQWKAKIRPLLKHLDPDSESYAKILKFKVFELFGASIGLSRDQFSRAS